MSLKRLDYEKPGGICCTRSWGMEENVYSVDIEIEKSRCVVSQHVTPKLSTLRKIGTCCIIVALFFDTVNDNDGQKTFKCTIYRKHILYEQTPEIVSDVIEVGYDVNVTYVPEKTTRKGGSEGGSYTTPAYNKIEGFLNLIRNKGKPLLRIRIFDETDERDAAWRGRMTENLKKVTQDVNAFIETTTEFVANNPHMVGGAEAPVFATVVTTESQYIEMSERGYASIPQQQPDMAMVVAQGILVVD